MIQIERQPQPCRRWLRSKGQHCATLRRAASGKLHRSNGQMSEEPVRAITCKVCDAATANSLKLGTVTKGSKPTSAPQHKHLFRGSLNVSCRHPRPATLHLQRMHAFRPPFEGSRNLSKDCPAAANGRKVRSADLPAPRSEGRKSLAQLLGGNAERQGQFNTIANSVKCAASAVGGLAGHGAYLRFSV